MTAKWVKYHKKCEELETELNTLKKAVSDGSALRHDQSVSYLIDTAEAFLGAAKGLMGEYKVKEVE